MRIGVDVMGGDSPPEELVKELEGNITLFASDSVCQNVPFPCQQCSESIEMDDDPLVAIRKKRDSSMIRGITALANGEIDALITCGNTGAIVGATKISLGMAGPWSRPALLTLIPTTTGHVAVIDVGASVDNSPERYLELAQMGVAFMEKQGIHQPRIGLLNIGAEETKGRQEMRKALQTLTDLPGFIGNVESMDVFAGSVDLLLTDGFTGNIFLKTSEGLATFLLDLFAKTVPSPGSVIADIDHHLSKNHYSGALLLGLKRPVFKCHGNARSSDIARTIEWASKLSV